MDDRPIGVFDSGLGGLTVVKEVIKTLPNEDIVYLGDTARVPYGTRSKKTIQQFAEEDTDFFNKEGVKCLVIACNTISSVARNNVIKKANVKVFDVVSSGVEEIIESKENSVGLIATQATVSSRAYEKATLKLNKNIFINSIAAPLLIPLIEDGEIKGKIIDLVLEKYLNQFKSPLRTLVLGCTHFPIVEGRFKHIRPLVNIINPANKLATNIKKYLLANNLTKKVTKTGRLEINVTDFSPRYKEVASIFLGKDITSLTKRVKLRHFDD